MAWMHGSSSGSFVLILALSSVAGFIISFGGFTLTPNDVSVDSPAFEPVVVPVSFPEPVSRLPRILDLGDLRAPRIQAAAAMLFNPSTGEVLWEKNGFTARPIASITKVMTALVHLENQSDLALDVVISPQDAYRSSTTYLRRRERVTLEHLLHLALIGSDNVAARAIARTSRFGTDDFVERMNKKATELGLDETRFVDPSGLDEGNVSSPFDVARLVVRAASDLRISKIMRKPDYEFRTSRRRVRVRNTNRLVRGRYMIDGGKTGYIDEAGYCLAAVVSLPNGEDQLAVVVLGAGSNSRRFSEVRRLVEWALNEGKSLIFPENN